MRFRSSNHRSRIWAFYKDGAPSHHVREENVDGNESGMDSPELQLPAVVVAQQRLTLSHARHYSPG